MGNLSISVASVTYPLEQVHIKTDLSGRIMVLDGEGRVYVDSPVEKSLSFGVSGTRGNHTILLMDGKGKLMETLSFDVICETSLDDQGVYGELFKSLKDSLFIEWSGGPDKYIRIGGKAYSYYVSWLRDHVHTLKGMQYFDVDVKTGIELYGDHPREDGMIWDKCKRMCHSELQNGRDIEFAPGDYVRKIPGHPTRRWMRIPVENDVEFLFVEGLHRAWMASGDTPWMAGYLDAARSALEYSLKSPVRWSEKYGLLKRGYTIDSWDFQSHDDVARSGTIMKIDEDRTEFNIFHGDNTGYARSCLCLADMLKAVGSDSEADKWKKLSREIMERLENLSWNGSFFTHMAPEREGVKRDLGDTDTSKQITMSNAMALNRCLDRDKRCDIIRSYQRIKEETSSFAPAEWFNCYPPFEKGFHVPKWEYMNGGVSTIVAGELSLGAFKSGSEAYGADILKRTAAFIPLFGGFLPNCYRGNLKESGHKGNLTPLSLHNLRCAPLTNLPLYDLGCFPKSENRFHGIEFEGIPQNGGKGEILALSDRNEAAVPIPLNPSRRFATLYILHTAAGKVKGWDKQRLISPGLVDVQDVVGSVTFRYTGGFSRTEFIQTNKHLESYMLPPPDMVQGRQRRKGPYRIAWQGENGNVKNVGMFICGLTNPLPEEEVESLILNGTDGGALWLVAGLTLSDGPPSFERSILSYGIPNMWGGAVLLSALLEGLAGVVPSSPGCHTLIIAPRWASAGRDEVRVCVAFPASGGYARYDYRYQKDREVLELNIASNAREIRLELLLPPNKRVISVMLTDSREERNVLDYDVVEGLEADSLIVNLTGLDMKRIMVQLSQQQD